MFPIADDWLCSDKTHYLRVVLALVDLESESGMKFALSYYARIILKNNTSIPLKAIIMVSS